MSAARGHVLVVTISSDHAPDDPDYDWTVECLNPDLCGGWTECTHADGHHIEDDAERDDAEGEGTYTFHGVEHSYHPGYNWTVPFEGCVVAENIHQWSPESADEIAHQHGVGRHVVGDDWYDESSVSLAYISTEARP